jgi:polysaccharide biosynthesis transport protein
VYKNTQQQLVAGRFVLLAALRKPEVAKLASVQQAQKEGDIVGWLMKFLSVSFPGKAEIMQVDVSRPEAKEAATLVQAIVDAYLTDVVDAERNQKRVRLSELDRAYIEKETDVRAKREDLKKLAETLGTSDTETLNVKQKLALDLLNMYRQGLEKARFEVRTLQSQLASQQAMLKGVDTADVPDVDLQMAVQMDPIAKQLSTEISFRKLETIYTTGAVANNAKTAYAGQGEQNLKTMQQQYDARVAELTDMVRQKRRGMVQVEVQRLEAALAVMAEQEQNQIKMVEDQQKEAEKFGTSTVDIEMMRNDIKNIETLLTSVATEREKLRVEIRAVSRVTALGRADVPELPGNLLTRAILTVLAGLVGLCCPAAVVAWYDIRAKRINNSADVSRGLRLPVIGLMPLIPARVIRRLGSPSKRNKAWHMRLTESVDGITARVLRKADMEQSRVIMVSSAAGGEGKTTLATQLAMSLARAGRRTILVDFDLRRPAFDEVFGLPLEPGVCEVLRRQNPVSALVHQLPTNNLSVLTAGRWDRSALASLSNGAAATMFKQLRENYEFVVVDTSPILPVADARFVSQHVDSVVLSVFRDVSEAPKIEAACEILSAFGVASVEAVVTGPNNMMYGKHMGYESTISA